MVDARPVATYIGLGSNLGDRAGHLAGAVRALETVGRVRGVASVYETEPVGAKDQPAYLNTVVALETERAPESLLAALQEIEAAAGRSRPFPGAPRTLDLDLLLYGERMVERPDLVVPHPRLCDRAFVLVPLLELEPRARDPRTGRPYVEALRALTGGRRRDDVELHEPGVRRIMNGEELLNETRG